MATLWTPANLVSKPELWFDDTSELSSVSGLISQLNDKSGNGRHFVQNSSSNRPSASAMPNGARSLRFDGSDYLVAPSNALGILSEKSANWAFAVYNSAVSKTTDMPIFYAAIGSATAGRFALEAGAPAGQNQPFIYGRRIDSDGVGSVGAGVALINQWVMSLGVLDYAERKAKIAVNGNGWTEASPLWAGAGLSDSSASSGMRIGASTNGALTFQGDIAALVVGAGSQPSVREVEKLIGWAAHQFGLSALLPVSHPYRNFAPEEAYLSGNVVKDGGGTADRVLVWDWDSGSSIDFSRPDAAGNWKAVQVRPGERCGITYIAEGLRPVTHGPYVAEVAP